MYGISRLESRIKSSICVAFSSVLCIVTGLKSSLPDRYLGFKECQDEVMRFLVEVEGWDAMDKLCNRLMTHLDKAGDKFRAVNGNHGLQKLQQMTF